MADKSPTETGIREGNSKFEPETKTMVRKSSPPLKPLTFKSFIIFSGEVVWFCLIVIPSIVISMIGKLFKREKDLRGKIVLITGSGNGLGKEMALQLSELGCTVLCVDQREEDNRGTLAQIRQQKGEAQAYTCDVSDSAQVKVLSERILDEHGRVDILINNAGLIYGNSILTGSSEMISRVLAVNFLSTLWMIRAFLPSMIINKEGHIVCICSASAIHALGNGNIYTCTKFAILGLVYSMLEEFRSKDLEKEIKISCAMPYFISTSKVLTKQWNLRFPPLTTERAAELIIQGFRKEFRFYTVPWISYGYSISSLLRLLPANVYKFFRDKNYADFIGEALPGKLNPVLKVRQETPPTLNPK